MIKSMKWLFLVSLTIVACNNDDEEMAQDVPVTAGSANFSKYVALGNSLTAGFTDGALFKAGQQNAYPKLMADQFALVGGGAFNIPLMSDNVGGLMFGTTPLQGPRLIFNGSAPVPLPMTPTTQLLPALTGQFNNMGVPGAKSFHLLAPGYGNPTGVLTGTANPYFVRFASSTSTSVLADAMAQQPTFFSLWIGNNDVLGYAMSGGDGSNPITPATGAAGVGFDGTYNALVNTLTSGGAKGVVANIPYVTTIPFFTTVPFNAVPLTSGQATALNSGYATYNAGLVMAKNAGAITEEERLKRTITFVAGQNPVVIIDEYLTNLSTLGIPSYRQTTKEDFIVLSSQGTSAQAHLAAGNGTQYPLQDRWVVSKSEVTEIKTATDSYNATIKAAANGKGLAFVDVNAVMNQLANGGIRFDNYHMTSSFVQGGTFGLDGIHLTARANAYVANKFLEAINTTYGSTFKMYKPQDFVMSYPATLQ
jgi:lysophospholipase L1-like esterase